jgi:hypothetical protein
MNLANVEEGFAAIKMELWFSGGSSATQGWDCENNDCGTEENNGELEASHGNITSSNASEVDLNPGRILKGTPSPQPCPAYQFQFAVDGNVTTWDAATFETNRNKLQRVVDVFELFHDKNLVKDGPRDIELAIRLTGCGRLLTYALTHVYWA